MHRTRLAGALAIAAGSSLAIFSGTASATTSSITLACDKATFEYRTFGPPPQALAPYRIDLDGIPYLSGTHAPAGPLSVFEVPLGLQGHHVITASTHGTPVNAFSSASATVDCPVPVVAPPSTPTPPGTTPVPTGPRVEPLPRLVAPRKAQKPRCASIPKGAGPLWYVKRGCRFPVKPRVWAVTGERKAQGPSPASLVAGLLVQVPALAGDTPYASSIRQGAGGRSSSGGVSAKERGRLVPAGIPGHPWTSKTTAPGRGVATNVSWRSGRLTVSVLYSASRGQSTTSVSVR